MRFIGDKLTITARDMNLTLYRKRCAIDEAEGIVGYCSKHNISCQVCEGSFLEYVHTYDQDSTAKGTPKICNGAPDKLAFFFFDVTVEEQKKYSTWQFLIQMIQMPDNFLAPCLVGCGVADNNDDLHDNDEAHNGSTSHRTGDHHPSIARRDVFSASQEAGIRPDTEADHSTVARKHVESSCSHQGVPGLHKFFENKTSPQPPGPWEAGDLRLWASWLLWRAFF